MMKNTIERGEDISRCAQLYTVGIDGIGLAVVADSFGALQKRVEEQNNATWDEVYEALATDDDNALKIQDNSVELRIEEHVAALNALDLPKTEYAGFSYYRLYISRDTMSSKSKYCPNISEYIYRLFISIFCHFCSYFSFNTW